ncbi:AAA family ATPase [Vibrio crassostreae]|nr:AAA family ATPase [Vibrio crassostreae]CAK2864760.1 AAA family ATPase [Vibrio crassostreae]CAK3477693.1 AAA family ATPase [Vibrio crassostreae]
MDNVRQYQSEKPEKVDSFAGKGHFTVAKAISNVILNDSSQHIIGVEGSLGAGKSTVIEMVRETIEAHNCHMVTFDADRYHSNLKSALIKTIETELSTMVGSNSTSKRKLTQAVEVALGKRLQYTKDTNSHISLLAISFMFSLGVSAFQIKPAITYILSELSRINSDKSVEEVSSSIGVSDSLAGIVSILLTLSPAIAYGILKLLKSDVSLGDLVKRNSKDTISETIDITRDVGAMELKEAFDSFTALIPENETLILVIDNIDRVTPDVARELWSDIEILASFGNPKFRVLLPYSELHLATALEADNLKAGKEYISKRIPIPFTAPPIVTTGWREQFDVYWTQTLPDLSGSEGAKELIDVWCTKVTPRYLKSLINRVATKVDSCPEPNADLDGISCALYLMAHKDNGISLDDLVSKTNGISSDDHDKIMSSRRILLKYVGREEHWAKRIAALHFQTTFDIAESELISEPIRAAFSAHDTKRLVELEPLLGFDLFVNKQIEQSDTSDLVKIAAKLANEKSGLALLLKLLPSINHEIVTNPHNKNEFDSELVESYLTLQKADVGIEHFAIKALQNTWESSIDNLFSQLPPLLDQSKQSEFLSSEQELVSHIEQCYSYFEVTGNTPRFIDKLTPEFFVLALYSAKQTLKKWSMEELLSDIDSSSVVKLVCRRHMALNDDYSLLDIIRPTLKIGKLHNLTSQDFLSGLDISTQDIDVCLSLAPFTDEWHDENSEPFAFKLIEHYEKATRGNSWENETDQAQYLALTAAAIIKSYSSLTTSITVQVGPQPKQRQNQQVVVWLVKALSATPSFTTYLSDYLVFCSASNIMTWCQHSTMTEHLISNLGDLIDNKRINRLKINEFVNGGYAFLKDNLEKPSTEQLIYWLNGWESTAENPESWDDVLVKDILEFRPDRFIETLYTHFENELSNSEQLERSIQSPSTVATLVLQDMAKQKYVLNNQEPVYACLKDVMECDDDFDIEFVRLLSNFVSGHKKAGLARLLSSSLLKSTTPKDWQYRAITYFGERFTLPKLLDANITKEAVDLLHHALSDNNKEVINWLLGQSFGSDGWNLQNQNEASLLELKNAFHENQHYEDSQLFKKLGALINDSDSSLQSVG